MRKRIELAPEELRRLGPTAKDAVLSKALDLIHATNADDFADRSPIIFWGQEYQSSYGKLLNEGLALIENGTYATVSRRIARLQKLLEGVRLKEILGFEKKGLVDRLIFKAYFETNILDLFTKTKTEIDQLVSLLKDDLPDLDKLRASFEGLSKRIEQLGNDVEAAAVAALFFAEHIEAGKSACSRECADLFTDRAMSLTKTLAQIRGSSQMRDDQINRPLRFIGMVQDVALVMVPALVSNYTAVRHLLERDARPTETQVDEIVRSQNEILDKFRNV